MFTLLSTRSIDNNCIRFVRWSSYWKKKTQKFASWIWCIQWSASKCWWADRCFALQSNPQPHKHCMKVQRIQSESLQQQQCWLINFQFVFVCSIINDWANPGLFIYLTADIYTKYVGPLFSIQVKDSIPHNKDKSKFSWNQSIAQ